MRSPFTDLVFDGKMFLVTVPDTDKNEKIASIKAQLCKRKKIQE